MAEKEAYQVEYDTFIENYKLGATSPEQVGELVVRMVQYFCDKNLSVATKGAIFNSKAAENVEKIDENTGKPIAVSKADLLTKATPEYQMVAKAKAHLQNIEQCINALKSLQKGVLNEYSHMGGV